MQNAIVEELRNVSEGVELCRKAYDNVVAEDRVSGVREPQEMHIKSHIVNVFWLSMGE